MKRNKVALALVALLSAGVLTACGTAATPPAEEVSSLPVASVAESETESSEAPVESEVSSGEEEVVSSTVDQPRESFAEHFANNPLSADEATQLANSDYSTTTMMSIASTFAGLWESEVTNAYNQLLKATEGTAEYDTIVADQEEWMRTKEEKVQEISNSFSGDTGTMGRLDRAYAIENFYKDKARELYEQLYPLDPHYTYAYTPY